MAISPARLLGPMACHVRDEDLVPPTALEDAVEMMPAEQDAFFALDPSPSAETTLREALDRLAEFLHTVTSLLAEFGPRVSLVKEGAVM
ncbi:unnamed protein product [Lampetra fluviatilis]